MGREIKRVPLDFDWPMDRVWEGFLNPYYKYAKDCPDCKRSGLTEDVRQLDEDWYAFDHPERRWQHKLEADEVQALFDAHRIDERVLGHLGKDPKTYKKVTQDLVDFVNETAQKPGGLFLGFHDQINKHICLEARAKKLGFIQQELKEAYCPRCSGNGTVYDPPEMEAKKDAWEPTEPPTGEGYQVWETVSEGSPISPVFPTADELVKWLVGKGYSPEAAVAFADAGWAPSMVLIPGKGLKRDIESMGALKEKD